MWARMVHILLVSWCRKLYHLTHRYRWCFKGFIIRTCVRARWDKNSLWRWEKHHKHVYLWYLGKHQRCSDVWWRPLFDLIVSSYLWMYMNSAVDHFTRADSLTESQNEHIHFMLLLSADIKVEEEEELSGPQLCSGPSCFIQSLHHWSDIVIWPLFYNIKVHMILLSVNYDKR